MPRRFHALVEIRRDWRTSVVRLSGEPPRDLNQLSAPQVMDYNHLTLVEPKKRTQSLSYPGVLSSPHFKVMRFSGV